LLDECPREIRTDIVFKLTSLPKAGIDTVLLRRNFDPTTINEAKAALASVDTPVTAKEAVQYFFEKHGAPPAYGWGRFGDGTAPVFYAALAEETCATEVRHRIRDAIVAAPSRRFYDLLACDFAGTVVNLHGKEVDHPELISPTEDGYPFCQALAHIARGSGVHAFHTPSARHRGGTCTPVFTRPTLTNERSIARAAFIPDSGALKYERLPA
jgi:RES domain-containing protein